MQSGVRASIVVPVYNQVFYTRVCLASLEHHEESMQVIVVDNGSTDETPEVLAAWAEQGRSRLVLRQDGNLGFAGACNAGAGAAIGEFVVFLNNDTFVLPGWLDNLLRPFADPSITITGSRLLYPTGHVQHAGVAFDDIGPHHIFVGIPGDSPVVLEQRDYQVVTGAALAIRAAEFRRQSGFDTSYRNSLEDVDLCLRVRRDGGRIVYVPTSVAYHFESMTEGRVGPLETSNYELFMERWSGKFECDLPRLEEAAVQRGIDLDANRVPSRREVIDREAQMARTEAELARTESELARTESALARAEEELNELRRIRRTRSVRTALWMRNAFRRVVPART
jgi:GT2 family glycosyltransferase